MYGHKGWFMNVWDKNEHHITTNFTGFDDLAHKYGVDLYLTGHVHLYQRFLPLKGPSVIKRFAPPVDVDRHCVSDDGHVYKNPKYMTTIVAGSPGDREISFVGECLAMDALNALSFHNSQVVCRDSYGYGHLQAHNSTHLSWKWEETAKPSIPIPTVGSTYPQNSEDILSFKDHLWIVKDRK